ncbi:hypothetical protein LBMAG53_28970 [Planctomycetota bacterium]|nr:hypothetical protein LBMAG53_28970 [Planctomycetota bacterium]
MFSVALSGFVTNLLVAGDPPEPRTRFHQFNDKFNNPKDPADPQIVTYLGGKGEEWASGGGFQPDGSVIVVGTAAGPVFDLAGGVAVKVIGGSDGSAPAITDAQLVKVVEDKKSGTKHNEVIITGSHTAGAPFVVKLAKGGKVVQSAIRLPWGVGSCNAGLVDTLGNIYIAGLAGANIKILSPQAANPTIAGAAEGGTPSLLFLAGIAPDLSSVRWCATFPDLGIAPELRFSAKGELVIIAGHRNIFSAKGDFISHLDLRQSKRDRAVNPVDGSVAIGYDTNTKTGREPWRQPHLEIYNTDGTLRNEYYAWAARLVGTPSSREVSDSSIKYLNYSDDGRVLLLSGWSDGGNSVLHKQPYDLRTPVKCPGLGMSAWGANAGSFCHLIRMDPENGQVTGRTMYLAYLKSKNKPSGLRTNHLNLASDGSNIVCGTSSYGFIQTRQSGFKGDYIGGSFVTVMNQDLSDLRFAAIVPGAGEVLLNLGNNPWVSAKGVVGGRHRVLVVSGAQKHDEFWTINPVQTGFGGGNLDAAVVVLDLGSVKP